VFHLWGSFYGPALLTHVQCPKVPYKTTAKPQIDLIRRLSSSSWPVIFDLSGDRGLVLLVTNLGEGRSHISLSFKSHHATYIARTEPEVCLRWEDEPLLRSSAERVLKSKRMTPAPDTFNPEKEQASPACGPGLTGRRLWLIHRRSGLLEGAELGDTLSSLFEISW